MELNDIFSKYVNPVIHDSSKLNIKQCKECGGICCQTMGCHISPFDLKEISYQFIIDFIEETNCISIDWWEGSPFDESDNIYRVYFLRLKNRNAKIIDPSYGGICSILTDVGCPLSFEYRPRGARDLIPEENDCRIEYSKQQCAIDWYPYQNTLEKVYNYYCKKGEVTSFYDEHE